MSRFFSWYRRHLGARIIGTVIGFVTIAWVVTAYYTVNSERQILDERTDALGHAVSRAVGEASIESLLTMDYPVLKTHIAGIASGSDDIRYLFIEREVDGELVVQWPESAEALQQAIQGEHQPYRHPIETAGETLGWVVLGLSTTSTQQFMTKQFMAIGLSLTVVFFGLAACLWVFLHSILGRRLRSLGNQAQRLGTGNLKEAIQLSGEDELGTLASTLETMRVGLHESHRAIQLQNEKLKEMDRLKGEFVAHMSHEIRTPLAALVGYCELLQRDKLEPKIRNEAMAALERNSDHLLQLVNDILDLSRIESGRVPIESIATDPIAICNEVREVIMPSAEAKGLELRFDMGEGADAPVLTDSLRLKQIVINLVSNAVKFTTSGSVEVRVRSAPGSEGQQVQLTVEVEDTGCGLTQKQEVTIFDSFTQADSSVTRRFGGTGLGLPISRRLAELLGGDLTVKSVWSEGSIFTLRLVLPLAPSGAAVDERIRTRETAIALEAVSPRVLLAEDGLDNQRIVTLMLERTGVDVTVVENGQLAVESALASLEAGIPFDLLLMDIQMPVMDGNTATQTLRASGYTHPIVALTAHAMPEDRTQCLESGCNDVIIKPVKRSDLLRAVERNVESRSD